MLPWYRNKDEPEDLCNKGSSLLPVETDSPIAAFVPWTANGRQVGLEDSGGVDRRVLSAKRQAVRGPVDEFV